MTHQKNRRRRRLDRAFFTNYSIVGVVLGILAFTVGSYFATSSPLIGGLANGIGSTLVVASTLGLVYTRISRDIYYDDVRYLVEREESGFRHIYKSPQDADFVDEVKTLLKSAKKEIIMYGIGLSILKDDDAFDLLSEAAETRRAKVIIFLADAKSDLIKLRLDEEAQYRQRREGEEYIQGVYNDLTVGNPGFFDVRLFQHYPTFAIIIIDTDVFCYSYGYQTSGTAAPVLHLKGDSKQAQYYRKQIDLLGKSYPRAAAKQA